MYVLAAKGKGLYFLLLIRFFCFKVLIVIFFISCLQLPWMKQGCCFWFCKNRGLEVFGGALKKTQQAKNKPCIMNCLSAVQIYRCSPDLYVFALLGYTFKRRQRCPQFSRFELVLKVVFRFMGVRLESSDLILVYTISTIGVKCRNQIVYAEGTEKAPF